MIVEPGDFGLSVVDGRQVVSCSVCAWSAPVDTVQGVVEKSVRHVWSAHPPPPPSVSSFDGAKLIYVDRDENVAYFSSDPDASGDDWNDSPWEHNAGPPSVWEVQVGWFGGGFQRPGQDEPNSWYSVDDINAGKAPWLVQSYWSVREAERQVVIPSGVGVQEFMRLIAEGGGYAVVIPSTGAP